MIPDDVERDEPGLAESAETDRPARRLALPVSGVPGVTATVQSTDLPEPRSPTWGRIQTLGEKPRT